MTNPTPLSIATHGPHKGYPTPKPCPFCGSTNLRFEFAGSQGFICCDNCGTQGPCDERAADPICDIDAAYLAWNRRAALVEPQPVPVSERLPGAGDCDAEGRCWIHMPDIGTAPSWRLVDPRDIGPYHTHWLPAHALPVPVDGGEA